MTKVLLVEDDNNLREIYEARLAAEGYDIVTAKDGEEALDVAKENKPDLIISDVMMPRVSGFEMLDILRTTDGLKNTKVIMLTALGQTEDKARADNLGADRYLVKSQVTLEDIVKTAGELLGGDVASSEAELTPAAFAAPQLPSAETAPVVVGVPTVPVQPSPVPASDPSAVPMPQPMAAAPIQATAAAPVVPQVAPASPVQVALPTPESAPLMNSTVAPEVPAENHAPMMSSIPSPMPTIPIATPPVAVSVPVEPSVTPPSTVIPQVTADTPVVPPTTPAIDATQTIQTVQPEPIAATPISPLPEPIQQSQAVQNPIMPTLATPTEQTPAEAMPATPVTVIEQQNIAQEPANTVPTAAEPAAEQSLSVELPVVDMPNLEVQPEAVATTSVDETPAQPPLSTADTTVVTDAQTTNDEEATIEKQIDDFVHTESVMPQVAVPPSVAEETPTNANESNNASLINQAVEQLVSNAPNQNTSSADDASNTPSVSQIPGKKVIQPIAQPEGKPDLATLVAQEEMNENLQRGVTGAPVIGNTEETTPPLPPLANPAPPIAPAAAPVTTAVAPPAAPVSDAFTPNNGGSAEANAL